MGAFLFIVILVVIIILGIRIGVYSLTDYPRIVAADRQRSMLFAKALCVRMGLFVYYKHTTVYNNHTLYL